MTRLFILALNCSLLIGCASTKTSLDPYAHIDDKKVVTILKQSFATLGGLENWQSKKGTSLSKTHQKSQRIWRNRI